jgi:hypothetical protein
LAPSKHFAFTEITDAYNVYKRITNTPNNHNTVAKFIEFLGGDALTPEAMEKVGWLLGPHAETLYKAWKIKNDAIQGSINHKSKRLR